jgi:hypothetical protein
MKVIIAGSRDYNDYHAVCDAILESGLSITEVVCGDATGVDALGARWAQKCKVTVKHFPADWNKHKKAAGPIRNRQMADYADALICLHHESRGSLNMCYEMRAREKPVFEIRV